MTGTLHQCLPEALLPKPAALKEASTF